MKLKELLPYINPGELIQTEQEFGHGYCSEVGRAKLMYEHGEQEVKGIYVWNERIVIELEEEE